MAWIRYIKARFNEKSTWMGIGTAVAGAAALAVPYSWIVICVGTIAILVPTKDSSGDSN